MAAERRSNEERTRTTRQALLTAARGCFEADGYAGTNLDAIAAAARVSKGAIYHHFPTKLAVYDAVIVAIQAELSDHVDASVEKADTAWDMFVNGFVAFIEVAPEPGIRRLMLEAPAVLGWTRWQEIDEEHNIPLIMMALDHFASVDELAFPATTDLARVLLTISNALGTLVSQDVDPVAARARVTPVWEHLLRSLRTTAAPEVPGSVAP